MAYDLEEQEQLASLKAWWATYGKLIVTVVTIALVALAGWRAWQTWQTTRASKASALFEELQSAARSNDPTKTQSIQDVLVKDYGRTVYAALGALELAKVQVAAKNLDGAKTSLRWVVDQSAADDAKAIARVRLAGVLLDQKAYDDALKLLDNPPQAYAGLYADRRGDILVAQGKTAEARTAYGEALAKLGTDAGALRSIVQIKLDALGEG